MATLKIVITGIPGYDGEYDFDPSYFTNKELHTIKRIAGVRAGELDEALEADDNDIAVAFTAIALVRHGKALHEDVLWNANVGCIRLDVVPDAEADANPPAPGLNESGSENKTPSGVTSADGSGSPENGQSRTGLHPSELSRA